MLMCYSKALKNYVEYSKFESFQDALLLLSLLSPIPGAPERIASLRTRYEKLSSSIARNELRVSRQTTQLAKMNRSNEDNDDDDNDEDEEEDIGNEDATMAANEEIHVTPDQLRREEEEIRELEKKKRGLEDRISGMDRDLGGLLR